MALLNFDATNVPQSDRGILARRGEPLSVGTEADHVDRAGMAITRTCELARDHVPQTD